MNACKQIVSYGAETQPIFPVLLRGLECQTGNTMCERCEIGTKQVACSWLSVSAMYLSPEDLMSQLEVSASFSVAACETVRLHPEY